MNSRQIGEIINIAEKYGCQCLKDQKLSDYNTFGTGGLCPLMVEINGAEVLTELLPFMKRERIPFYTIGKGSNLIIEDREIPMVFLHMGKHCSQITAEGNVIDCQAGAALSAVSRTAKENSLSGMEFAYGIPGNIGGAVYMNAGAYGGEMKDIIISVTAVDHEGNIHTFLNNELDFGYRKSLFCSGGYVVVSAKISLKKGNMTDIEALMDELTAKRREKQPLEYRSAGSTFKRPEGTFAALLIEQCGLKGYSCGGAQVSEKHSGFVINRGGASFEDIMSVIDHVKSTVYSKTGIMLECEPEIITADANNK